MSAFRTGQFEAIDRKLREVREAGGLDEDTFTELFGLLDDASARLTAIALILKREIEARES